MRRWLLAGSAGLVILLLVFGAGRWTAPSRVETKERIKEVEVIKWQTKVETRVERVEVALTSAREHRETRRERRPDGTVIESVVVDKGKDVSSSISAVDSSKREEAKVRIMEKVVEREKLVIRETSSRPTWGIAAFAGADSLTITPNVFGASVERRILGPFYAGVWGSSQRSGGVSLAVRW